MRRKDREITDPTAIEDLLRTAAVGRLGMADAGKPYIVPVNFVYRERQVYIHSAHQGMKMDLLRRNPRVCFEADLALDLVTADTACGWGMHYRSVIGFGSARIIPERDGKREALNLLMEKYSGRGAWDYPDNEIGRVSVIRIDLESITGKQG